MLKGQLHFAHDTRSLCPGASRRAERVEFGNSENQGQTERFLILFEETGFADHDWRFSEWGISRPSPVSASFPVSSAVPWGSFVLLLIQAPEVASRPPYQMRLIAECALHIGLGFGRRHCKDAIKSSISGDLPLVLGKGSF